MNTLLFLTSVFLLVPLAVTTPTSLSSNSTSYLTATAIVTTPQNTSAFECWKFTTPLASSATGGTVGAQVLSFESLANRATYTLLPARFDGGVHNAPSVQLVIFLSGVIHLTLPNSTAETWVIGGANGMIVAADVTGTGHRTVYPTDETTVAIQVPFEGGVGELPAYEVAGEGPCVGQQIVQEVSRRRRR
ncbi:hypothetical protein K402DRAFT_356312 [Aulographum hederae CBS 113979]|uniref:Uncharacterized protein n=1 Tax=Aulographum hederae CBS 113979 TaxID=1176131 RepID=A0A6G1GYN9_9PEZI|nr:hypothetical protein K402DRAFT_356312 [Aulographum hederae CBS 113979]